MRSLMFAALALAGAGAEAQEQPPNLSAVLDKWSGTEVRLEGRLFYDAQRPAIIVYADETAQLANLAVGRDTIRAIEGCSRENACQAVVLAEVDFRGGEFGLLAYSVELK